MKCKINTKQRRDGCSRLEENRPLWCYGVLFIFMCLYNFCFSFHSKSPEIKIRSNLKQDKNTLHFFSYNRLRSLQRKKNPSSFVCDIAHTFGLTGNVDTWYFSSQLLSTHAAANPLIISKTMSHQGRKVLHKCTDQKTPTVLLSKSGILPFKVWFFKKTIEPDWTVVLFKNFSVALR